MSTPNREATANGREVTIRTVCTVSPRSASPTAHASGRPEPRRDAHPWARSAAGEGGGLAVKPRLPTAPVAPVAPGGRRVTRRGLCGVAVRRRRPDLLSRDRVAPPGLVRKRPQRWLAPAVPQPAVASFEATGAPTHLGRVAMMRHAGAVTTTLTRPLHLAVRRTATTGDGHARRGRRRAAEDRHGQAAGSPERPPGDGAHHAASRATAHATAAGGAPRFSVDLKVRGAVVSNGVQPVRSQGERPATGRSPLTRRAA
jgi:hypothetical protein